MERYEVVKVLGAGGGGKVLLAKEKESGKHVAIKEITLDPRKKTKTKEAVQKEAKILASLKHPHVVSMLESFLDDQEEQLFIVQDFCDGGTLEDCIKSAKSKNTLISESQVMQWFVQITMAVHHIHANKILHRDLKTQNVFLTKKGVAKIGDFGIARTMDSTIDMAQTCCGTPCYLSPELCQDMPYSSKNDVWSLGCLLYELCALKFAFDANNIVNLFYKIVKGEPEEIPKQYSQFLRELICQMLAKKPEERPSAGAILNTPYVQDHLRLFIKEKENLQEALLARNHLKSTGLLSKAITQDPQRSSSAVGSRLTPDFSKISKQRSNSATPTKNVPMATDDVKHDEQNDLAGGGQNRDEQVDSDYSDDFDELAEEEASYSDDFEEDTALNGTQKKPMGASSSPSGLGDAEGSNDDIEYPDDFEEDSDEEEVLDDILANARAAQEAKEEDVVEDSFEPGSRRQRLKEQVIGALGEEVFEQVCGQLENQSIEKTLAEGPEFEKVQSGSSMLETCYLVNELFIDSARPNKES
ncbi:serine/threonine-protein kinase Nek5-like [Actinia tenebrosa]|uniref:non-specific serine/threonine protein kinase n=1 Tax=Actinia tenebrosa TaxID=6105 RepID=A0A6P8I546_ACTTE|nr:serine/threonine-protein kinase Nek5-like [Actinia tenebrosa]